MITSSCMLQEVLTSAVESGISTFLFPAQHQHLADEWKGIVDFESLHCQGDDIVSNGTQVMSCNLMSTMLARKPQQSKQCPCQQVGRIRHVSSAEEMHAAAKDCNQPGYLVMDCSDWQIIPAENLVAAFQVSETARLCSSQHTHGHSAWYLAILS